LKNQFLPLPFKNTSRIGLLDIAIELNAMEAIARNFSSISAAQLNCSAHRFVRPRGYGVSAHRKLRQGWPRCRRVRISTGSVAIVLRGGRMKTNLLPTRCSFVGVNAKKRYFNKLE
jgi:hypothetical protein